MIKKIGVLFLLFVVSISIGYGESVRIDVTRSKVTKIPIAITISSTEVKQKQLIEKTIERDFLLVDYFEYVEARTESQFILALIYSEKKKSKAELKMTLVAQKTGSIIYAKRFTGEKKYTERLVHAVVDALIENIKGEVPIASTRIVYEASLPKQIYICDFDGLQKCKITNFNEPNLFPAWNNTKKLVAFNSFYGGYPRLLTYSMNDGKIKTLLKLPGLNTTAAFSPEGRRLAVTLSKDGNPEIYVVDLSTKKMKRLTKNHAVDTSPTWSPDGSQIAFVSNRSGKPQIYIKTIGLGKPKRITFKGRYNTNPSWSPQGNILVYTSLQNNVFQLHILYLDTGEITKITDSRYSCQSPSFAPDGRHIVFSQKRGGTNTLCIIDIIFRTIHSLRVKGTNPDWGGNA